MRGMARLPMSSILAPALLLLNSRLAICHHISGGQADKPLTRQRADSPCPCLQKIFCNHFLVSLCLDKLSHSTTVLIDDSFMAFCHAIFILFFIFICFLGSCRIFDHSVCASCFADRQAQLQAASFEAGCCQQDEMKTGSSWLWSTTQASLHQSGL